MSSRSRPNSKKLGSRPGRPGPWTQRSSCRGSCAQEAGWHRCPPCSVSLLWIDMILSNVLVSASSNDPSPLGRNCCIHPFQELSYTNTQHYNDHVISRHSARSRWPHLSQVTQSATLDKLHSLVGAMSTAHRSSSIVNRYHDSRVLVITSALYRHPISPYIVSCTFGTHILHSLITKSETHCLIQYQYVALLFVWLLVATYVDSAYDPYDHTN